MVDTLTWKHYGTGALVLFCLSSVAGLPCDSKAVAVTAHKGEVVLECPVSADISKTKHSVVIRYFDFNSSYTEEVLGCDWLKSKQGIDCLSPRVGAELITIQADRVLARLPPDRVELGGYYRCQLVPPESEQPFKNCSLDCPEVSKEISTTAVPAVVEHQKTDAPKDLGSPRSHRRDVQDFEPIRESLTAAVVVLSVVVIILMLLLLAAIILLRSQCRKQIATLCQERKEDRHEAQCHHTGENGQLSRNTDRHLVPGTCTPLIPDSILLSEPHHHCSDPGLTRTPSLPVETI